MRQLGCGSPMRNASTLAEIGKRLGRKGLAKVALVAKPETILGWFAETGGAEVRWLEASLVPGPAED